MVRRVVLCGQNDDGNITVRARVPSENKKFNTDFKRPSSALFNGKRRVLRPGLASSTATKLGNTLIKQLGSR